MVATALHLTLLTYGNDIHPKAHKIIRNQPNLFSNRGSWEQRFENLACAMSLAVGLDITAHFDYFSFTVSNEAKQRTGVNNLPKSKQHSWFAYGPKMREAGASGFTKSGVKPVVNGNNFDVENASANEILCYVVRRGATFIDVVYPGNGQTQATSSKYQSGDNVTVYDRLCRPHTDYDVVDTSATQIRDVKKSDGRQGIRLAKNIVSDKAEISVILANGEKAKDIQIAVYDMTGNIVYNGRGEVGSHTAAVTWNLTNNAGRFVANGTYLVVAQAKDKNGRIYMYSAKLGVKK
jgi:hypothetical protein